MKLSDIPYVGTRVSAFYALGVSLAHFFHLLAAYYVVREILMDYRVLPIFASAGIASAIGFFVLCPLLKKQSSSTKKTESYIILLGSSLYIMYSVMNISTVGIRFSGPSNGPRYFELMHHCSVCIVSILYFIYFKIQINKITKAEPAG
jgi:hypothetical protein